MIDPINAIMIVNYKAIMEETTMNKKIMQQTPLQPLQRKEQGFQLI